MIDLYLTEFMIFCNSQETVAEKIDVSGFYAQLATSQMSAVLQLASMLNYEAQNDTNLLRGGGGGCK